MTLIFNRRRTLALGAGAMSVAMFGAAPALAKNDADEAIKKFTGGKAPVAGKVKLDLPEIAENGNTVPMTVTVESPMTEQSHVTEVLIVADEPNVPEALLSMDNVILQPHQGSATLETRRAMGDLMLANLAAHFAGEPLPSPLF